MRVCLFLSLLLLYSCTKYAEFSKDTFGVNIHPVHMKLSRLSEVKWLVGRPKRTYISQSFTFMADLPNIKQDDLEFLQEKHDIDAWIIRLIVQRGSETLDLGSLYAPFQSRKLFRGNHKTGAPSNVSFKVYYSAAYASERFRSFSCPAFGHNLKIDSMSIKGDNEPFTISVTKSSPYPEKTQLVELSPSAFNGGNTLKGEYFVEIAPYNSKKKVILSNFKRIPQSIVISKEERIEIKSCTGVHPEKE